MPVDELLSRMQFAFTLSFHILFPGMTIGRAAYVAVYEALWLRTHDQKYLQLCRFWTKIRPIYWVFRGKVQRWLWSSLSFETGLPDRRA